MLLFDVASHLSKEGVFKLLRAAQDFPHMDPVFPTPCASLIGVCIIYRQIASIPLKWVQCTLPFQSQWKEKVRKRKGSEQWSLINLEGTESLLRAFLEKEKKWKSNLKGKFVIYVFIQKTVQWLAAHIALICIAEEKQFWNNLKMCSLQNFKGRAAGSSKEADTSEGCKSSQHAVNHSWNRLCVWLRACV